MIKTFYKVSIKTDKGIIEREVSTLGDHPAIAKNKALKGIDNIQDQNIEIEKIREEPCEIGNSCYD